MKIQENQYYTDQVFEKIELSPNDLYGTQFESCIFKNCDFSTINLSKCDFTNSVFENCNFSMIKFVNIGLDNVNFIGCKMVGVDFTNVKDFLFSVNFTHCQMDYVAFMKRKNRKGKFNNCSLKGADFSEADLTDSVFEKCDLSTAVFLGSVLNGVDFTSAYNFTINPEKNQLRKAKFSTN